MIPHSLLFLLAHLVVRDFFLFISRGFLAVSSLALVSWPGPIPTTLTAVGGPVDALADVPALYFRGTRNVTPAVAARAKWRPPIPARDRRSATRAVDLLRRATLPPTAEPTVVARDFTDIMVYTCLGHPGEKEDTGKTNW